MSKLTRRLDALKNKPQSPKEKAIAEAVEWYVAQEAAGEDLPSYTELAETITDEGYPISDSTIRRKIKEYKKHASS